MASALTFICISPIVFGIALIIHYKYAEPKDIRTVKIGELYYFDFKKWLTWHICTKEQVQVYYKKFFTYPFKNKKDAIHVEEIIKNKLKNKKG